MTGPTLHPAQQRVVEHRQGPLRVLGGPGTGTTTALVELVARRVREGLDPAHVLLLAANRRSAAELRDRVALRVGRTIREPVARTAHSYAFGLLRRQAVLDGLPPPRLLAGAEQELIVAELLAGDADRWPAEVRPALRTRTFAGQLRDLLLRAAERGLAPADLAELGRVHARPLWVAAAAFAAEYSGVTALAHPSAYDPAELVRAAVDLLHRDPGLLETERARRRLVVVDQYGEADPPLVDLLDALAGGGRDLVVAGDPDTSVFGFRGAEAAALVRFDEQFPRADGSPAPTVVLTANHRLPPVLLDAASRVSARLGGTGPQRAMTARPPDDGETEPGRLDVRVLASTSDEVAQVAAHLRRAHLVDGVPWSQMAVVLRAAGDLAALRRGLARHGVPVTQRTDEVALAQQAPVRALLDLLAVVAGRDEPSADRVADLLGGPFGRVDPVRLASVRRALLEHERRAGGARAADDLLAAVVVDGEPAPAGARALTPLSAVVAAGRAALPSGSVEQVLWAMWDASGVGADWRRTALAGGAQAAGAHRDLDAVLGLFDAAARFTDRLPGAGPAQFLDHVRAQQVPSVGAAPEAATRAAVTVLTAHATQGRAWHTVAVCRVQDELWPDVRRRDTVLQAGALVDVVAQGRSPSATEQVTALLAAERRLFYLAVTRARHSVLVTAVDDGEMRPSRLLDELHATPRGEGRTPALPDRVLSLAYVVGELRAAVCDPHAEPADRGQAAWLLAALARDGVPGAHPDQWYGLALTSDPRPLVEQGQRLSLSPSQIEGYLRCPLRWMLQRAGGDSGGALRQTIGVLVHQLAHDAATQQLSAEQVWQRYETLWAQVDSGHGWVARRERTRVDAMVSRLVDWLAGHEHALVASEAEIEVPVGDAVVRGRVDRLDRAPDGSVVVVDFKTGSSSPTAAQVAEHAQLGLYQWAVAQGGAASATGAQARPGGGELVHLGAARGGTAKVQRQPPLSEAADPDWPRALVETVRAGASRPVFAALVTPACGGCPVRASCPAQPEGGRVSA